MIVETAFLGALGCDCDSKIGLLAAQRLAGIGMKFIVRYVSLDTTEGPGDLDKNEVHDILSGGLALMTVQHVRYPGWVPSAQMGSDDGGHAARHTVGAGIPAGVTVWCDLEGIKGTAQETIDYVKGWHQSVRSAGYGTGIYVGGGCPLTSAELYSLPVDRYWRSFSAVPNVDRRGYCMLQLYPSTMVGGVPVDLNVVQKDYLGGLPRWVTETAISRTYLATLPDVDAADGADDDDTAPSIPPTPAA